MEYTEFILSCISFCLSGPLLWGELLLCACSVSPFRFCLNTVGKKCMKEWLCPWICPQCGSETWLAVVQELLTQERLKFLSDDSSVCQSLLISYSFVGFRFMHIGFWIIITSWTDALLGMFSLDIEIVYWYSMYCTAATSGQLFLVLHVERQQITFCSNCSWIFPYAGCENTFPLGW